MEVLAFLAPWVILGIGVIFVAFSGGPGRARQAYLTGGNRGFRALMPVLYVALAIAVPIVIIAARGEAVGGSGPLATREPSAQQARGKELFIQTCKTCHTLKAAGANGITGPNLDSIGSVNRQRVLNAIKNGGTGQNRMPKDLLKGPDAEAVSDYVAATAGQ